MAFISALFILPILFNKKIIIPRNSIPILLVSIVPWIQYYLKQIFYLENAFFSILYIFFFWLTVVIGFNLSINSSLEKDQSNTENLMYACSYTFIIASFLSCIVAILQWLGLAYDSILTIGLVGNRPYANLAQPNHLATFLAITLISVFYLYEKYKIHSFIAFILSIVIVFTIVLTQSRTIWLIVLFIIFYWFFQNKKYDFRLNSKILTILLFFFVVCLISLTSVNDYLNSYINITKTSSVVERISTGHLRLDLWNQMIHAIIEKPWNGYGWHQTTAAQYEVITKYPGKEWASSSHNIFLDILVWCGIPLGCVIILYTLYLYYILFKAAKSIENICGFLVLSILAIHAQLEFPLYYSYFLLIFGLFCGMILSQKNNSRTYKITSKFFPIVFTFSLGLIYVVFNEYNKISDNIIAGNTHEMNRLKTKVSLPYKLYLFDLFNERAKWIALYPYTKVNEDQLNEIRCMIKIYLTPYDLFKFAQLLAYNGYRAEAQYQLDILEIMYNKKYTYDQLSSNE